MRALKLGAATAAIGMGLWVGSALADGPPPSYPPGYTPGYAPTLMYDWTGVYVGGNLGGATTRSEWIYTDPTVPSVDFLGQSSNGFTGGGHVGAQIQWRSLVLGAEVAYMWMDQKATSASINANTSLTSDAKSVFFITTKVGFAYDNILAYFKGGYVMSDVDYRTTTTSTGALLTSSSHRELGWTAGAGLEYALWDHVIMGVEYDYVRFDVGSREQTPPGTSIRQAGIDTQAVTARLSFKLGGGRQ